MTQSYTAFTDYDVKRKRSLIVSV